MSHLHTNRNPMSEARRQFINGKLQPLADEARAIGEPSWIVGVLLTGGGVALIVGGLLMLKVIWS